MILTNYIQILSIKLIIVLILISLTHVQAMETINQSNPDEVKIIIDISKQKLYLYKMDNELIKDYPISTSKYGIGSKANSGKTPLGLHKIENKIGDNAQIGTIFKGRKNTGKIANINKENGDLVTTRIMWLKGLEAGKNLGVGIDSYKRYIYIHGTAEESKIGQPASHGCIRMLNNDVIDLFNRVQENTSVNIVMNQETISNLEKSLDK